MSHSQICYEELSLKHAWLNLWDKHMTTGRINQVFTSLLTPMCNTVLTEVQQQNPKESEPYGSHFPRQGSRFSFYWLYPVYNSVAEQSCCQTAKLLQPRVSPSPRITWNRALANPDRYRLDRTLAENFENTSHGPPLHSNFLCPSHVGPGVKVKKVTNEIEITFGTPKVY